MHTRSIVRRHLAGILACVTLSALVACGSAPTEGVGASEEALNPGGACQIWQERQCERLPHGELYCTCSTEPLSLATTAPDPAAADNQCTLVKIDVAVPAEMIPLGCTLGVEYLDYPTDNHDPLMVFACSKFIQTEFDFPIPAYVSACVGQPDPGFVMVGYYKDQGNQGAGGPCHFPTP